MNRHDKLPSKQSRARARAVMIEWITLGFLLGDVILIYLTMGKSQVMKTAWIDNLLSMTPPAVFLISESIRKKPPDHRFPYGYHRVVSIAFLIAATALFVMGAYLLLEAAMKIITAHHPTIGTMEIFGRVVWAGWPMVAAAIWSGISAAILGRKKLPLGPILHNKVIHADASMNKADWLTSAATVSGVLGIGLGWWWADAVAAAFLSSEILWDGFANLRSGFADLMDRIPERVDTQTEEPVVENVKDYFKSLPWIRTYTVRMHEEGHLFFGEALVTVSDESGLPEKIQRTIEEIGRMDWRIRDFTITPLRELPKPDHVAA